MKKYLPTIFATLFLFLFSCSKEETIIEEAPGNIPGMGWADGALEVIEEYELPEGVEILGAIKGIGDVPTSATMVRLKDQGGGDNHGDDHGGEKGEDHEGGKGGRCQHGSGGQWVALDIVFDNTSDSEKEIILPAGLVFECMEEGYQHGILLQEVLIKINGKGSVNIKLNLYCINRGKHGSNITLTYMLRGITSSKHMGHLTTKLNGKKIDTVFFKDEDQNEYHNLIDRLQNIVWAITNDNGVADVDWKFIESIQNITN